MTTMVIQGGDLITPLERRFTNLWIDGESVEKLSPGLPEADSGCDIIDATNCFVTPGLFDIQVNGGPECNLWDDPTAEDLAELRQNLVRSGVTSFLPTLITDEIAHLKKNIAFLQKAGAGLHQIEGGTLGGSRMPGIHLEGPCLSPEKPGVHPKEHLQPLTAKLMAELAGGAVRLITIAPELDESGESLRTLMERNVAVALGHSNATYEQAEKAFDGGIRLMTHTFNALPPLHHRAPGAVGAALVDDRVTCCVIADGLHLDPAAIKLVFKAKGEEKMVLVSDAAHTGTSKGGLVGSSIKLTEAVRNVVNWGVCNFAQAIRMATVNASRAVGIGDNIGHLSEGKPADVIIWDKKTLAVKTVMIGGKIVS
jgi:N-acetylglucosamine-6-phosphate deacetylase